MTGSSGNLNVGQGFVLKFFEIFNPVKEGNCGCPIVKVYDKNTKMIKMKTYNNLNQFETPNFYNNGSIITIANDVDSLTIEAG